MLRSVTRPDGKTVTFKYDALGRRKEKRFDGRIHRYLWDGNVVLHEWAYAETDSPQEIITEDERITFDRSEPADNVITWVYDTDSYVPTAKIENGKTYSIVSDYIGRPVQAYDECGTVVWQADYDIYGNLRNLRGDREFIPFRQVGQYEDAETGLYYNRFRYYDPNISNYISQDPIGLAGNNPTMYGYVFDSNTEVDPLGLNNVKTGAGRTHVTYQGVKNGLPYTGYASAPSHLGLSPDEIIAYRYNGNFDDFGGVAPKHVYVGEGVKRKQTARGLEQRLYEADLKAAGGDKTKVANKQNPVGENNLNRKKYLAAADEHLKTKGCY